MLNAKKNQKGQVLVLVALSLVVIIGIAALAIDYAYFYHTKNQLQGAADSAALAGAVDLDGIGTHIDQPSARNAAFAYAALNSAAGGPVQISNNYEGNNMLSPNNDITVGFWDKAAGEYFLAPVKDPQFVNAIQVRARRTSDSTGGGVLRILGKIFNATEQDISSITIAMALPAPKKPTVTMCSNICDGNIVTSLNTTPQGTQFYFQQSMGSPVIAWTAWLSNNVGAPEVRSYWEDFSKLPTKYCGQNINNNQGVVNVQFNYINSIVTANSATYMVKTIPVYGYKVLFPVLDSCSDPGAPPNPHKVARLTEGIITRVLPQSGSVASLFIVGTGDCTTCTANESAFACPVCGSSGATELDDINGAKLVK